MQHPRTTARPVRVVPGGRYALWEFSCTDCGRIPENGDTIHMCVLPPPPPPQALYGWPEAPGPYIPAREIAYYLCDPCYWDRLGTEEMENEAR